MLQLVEALNFRCLRYVRQRMDRFHVLVGPNASGKTTFLDVIAFLSGLVKDGLPATVGKMSPTFEDLLFRHEGRIPGLPRPIVHSTERGSTSVVSCGIL